MRITRIALWLVAVVTLVGEATGAPQPRRSEQSLALRDERAFAAELKRSLRADDRQAVAGLLRYPARVFVQQKPYPIFVKDRDSLAEMYDMVFTPHLRCAVAESREPADGEPRPKHPLLLARGVVSLAGGRIVAERLDGKYRITRLTSFGDTSTRGGRPRPVTFPAGRSEAQLGGRVPEDGSDAYLVTARAGDRLQATISHFPAKSLALRVSRRETARFLKGVNEQGSVWSGRLSESGEYVVEVVRRASYCEPPVIAHLLTLSLTHQ